VEVFAQGIGGFSEDFKRVQIATGIRRSSSRIWAEKGYEAQLREFLSSLRDGRAAGVNLRDGVRATIGCLKMLESARTLAPCEFDLDSILEA
jgi:hypothetical protein